MHASSVQLDTLVAKGIKRITKKLRAKRELFSDQSFVTLRDIIVTQTQLKSNGEFNDTVNFSADRSETIFACVERIKKLIEQFARITAIQHLNDINHIPENSESSKTTLKKHKSNHITRISTHEHFFFPAEEQGAIPEILFLDLLLFIETLAKELAQNVHLALGTFPVIDANFELYNKLVYVQCGASPRIDVITKALPYVQDPEYSGTRSPMYGSKSSGSSTITSLSQKIEELNTACLAFSALNFHKMDNLLFQIQRLCYINPDYAKPDCFDEKKVSYARKYCDSLDEKISTLRNQKTGRSDIAAQIRAEGDEYIGVLQEVYNYYLQTSHSVLTESLGITDQVYGGYIQCKTEGGINFSVVVDICLDFNFDVAANRLKHDVSKNLGDLLFPELISQLVLSNHITLKNKDGIISQSGVVTHCDSMHPGLKAYFEKTEKFSSIPFESTSRNIKTGFGHAVDMHVCQQQRLFGYTSYYSMYLDFNNEIALQKQALNTYLSLYPQHGKAAKSFVMNTIFEIFYRFFIAQYSLSREQIVNFYDAIIEPVNIEIARWDCLDNNIINEVQIGLTTFSKKLDEQPIVVEWFIELCFNVIRQLRIENFNVDLESKDEAKTAECTALHKIGFVKHSMPRAALHPTLHKLKIEGSLTLNECVIAELNLPLTKIMARSEISICEFKNILGSRKFFALIRNEIVDEKAIDSMRKGAPFLLKEPENYVYVFDLIKTLGKSAFHDLNSRQREILYTLPYEIFNNVIKVQAIPIRDYLEMDPLRRNALFPKLASEVSRAPPTPV